MRSWTVFLVLVLSSMILGWAIGSWFDAQGVKQKMDKQVDDIVKTYTLLPRSDFITSWRTNIGGVVAEINAQSITIEDGERTVWLPLAENIAIEKRLGESGSFDETLMGLSVEDIRVNDRVTVLITANADGDLTVTKLIILAYE